MRTRRLVFIISDLFRAKSRIYYIKTFLIVQIRNYPERRAAYGPFPPLWRIFPKHTIKDTAQLVKKGLHNKVDGADGDGSLSGLWHFGGNDERVSA